MKVTSPAIRSSHPIVSWLLAVVIAAYWSSLNVRAAEIPVLTTQHGLPFRFEQLKGKPSVVHFGFTYCPVVCPTTLNEVATYMAELGPDAGNFNFVFVTVDPERDTAKTLKDYIEYFDSRIIAVTGSPSGIRRLADRFGTKYEKRLLPDGGYEMAHAIYGYLLDKTGKQAGTLYLGAESNHQAVLRRIRHLTSE